MLLTEPSYKLRRIIVPILQMGLRKTKIIRGLTGPVLLTLLLGRGALKLRPVRGVEFAKRQEGRGWHQAEEPTCIKAQKPTLPWQGLRDWWSVAQGLPWGSQCPPPCPQSPHLEGPLLPQSQLVI